MSSLLWLQRRSVLLIPKWQPQMEAPSASHCTPVLIPLSALQARHRKPGAPPSQFEGGSLPLPGAAPSSRESLLAANVMVIRSFAALKKTSGAFARSKQFQGCGFQLDFNPTQPQRCHHEEIGPHVFMRALGAKVMGIRSFRASTKSRAFLNSICCAGI